MPKIKKFLPEATEIWVWTDTHGHMDTCTQDQLLDSPLVLYEWWIITKFTTGIGPIVNNYAFKIANEEQTGQVNFSNDVG